MKKAHHSGRHRALVLAVLTLASEHLFGVYQQIPGKVDVSRTSDYYVVAILADDPRFGLGRHPNVPNLAI